MTNKEQTRSSHDHETKARYKKPNPNPDIVSENSSPIVSATKYHIYGVKCVMLLDKKNTIFRELFKGSDLYFTISMLLLPTQLEKKAV